MDQNDIFYRAFRAYRNEFEGNRDDHLFHKAVNARKNPNDFLEMTFYDVRIEEDWILAIEKGIDYIGKAIREDRQFIRNEGEVLPIERIRRVSKDSISDLAKHSDYITKLPENPDDNLIPEKLLMIKRENDYLIYENRVVYTTLSYLKDFISERLEKIKEVTNKYDGKCQIRKKVDLGYRKIDFMMNFEETRNNDPIALAKNGHQNLLKRLDRILNDVLILLKTPLMQELSKAPLVTRPVQKTNVLKMNTNFRESLYVFDYVCAYNKPGYSIEKKTERIAPLSADQEDLFTDIIQLSSFLTYMCNHALGPELEERFLEEEKRRKKLAEDELLARIAALMEKARKSGKEIGEYLALLEDGYRILEERLEEAKKEMVLLEQKHQKEMEELKATHQEEIKQIEAEHQEEISRIYEENEAAIAELRQAHEGELSSLRESLTSAYEARLNDAKTREEGLEKELEEAKKVRDDAVKAKTEAEEALSLCRVELLALRLKTGGKDIDPNDYTSKERFDQLEMEKELLDRFFDKAWGCTKKAIRKKHLTIEKKPKKGKGGDAE